MCECLPPLLASFVSLTWSLCSSAPLTRTRDVHKASTSCPFISLSLNTSLNTLKRVAPLEKGTTREGLVVICGRVLRVECPCELIIYVRKAPPVNAVCASFRECGPLKALIPRTPDACFTHFRLLQQICLGSH